MSRIRSRPNARAEFSRKHAKSEVGPRLCRAAEKFAKNDLHDSDTALWGLGEVSVLHLLKFSTSPNRTIYNLPCTSLCSASVVGSFVSLTKAEILRKAGCEESTAARAKVISFEKPFITSDIPINWKRALSELVT